MAWWARTLESDVNMMVAMTWRWPSSPPANGHAALREQPGQHRHHHHAAAHAQQPGQKAHHQAQGQQFGDQRGSG
jgi:hypothetical protein